jgi:hypothetical protein
MRPTDEEPDQPEIEKLVTGEERRLIQKPEVPDDVKAEILERLDVFEESDLEREQREDAGNEP